MQQAISTLHTIPEVESESIASSRLNNRYSFFAWSFTSRVQDSWGRIYKQDEAEEVTHIELYPNGSFTLGEAVKRFGEPEQVAAISGCADTRWLGVNLLYPHLGVIMGYFKPHWGGAERVKLKPNEPVEQIIYFASNLYEELMSSQLLVPGEDPNNVVESLQPWEGFGEVSYLDLCPSYHSP